MCNLISCLVTRAGKVLFVNGLLSHAEMATRLKVDEDKCLKYEYSIEEKKLIQDFGGSPPFEAKQSHDQAALAFFEECAGTPEKLVAFVRKGNWQQDQLTPLLSAKGLKAFVAKERIARQSLNENITKHVEIRDKKIKAAENGCAIRQARTALPCTQMVSNARKAYDTAVTGIENAARKAWSKAEILEDKLGRAHPQTLKALKTANTLEKKFRDAEKSADKLYAKQTSLAYSVQRTEDRLAVQERETLIAAFEKVYTMNTAPMQRDMDKDIRAAWLAVYAKENGVK